MTELFAPTIHRERLATWPEHYPWIEDAGLEGIVQEASFHPAYCFDGVSDSAVELATNRSPFPMLHLLREDSISEAIDTMPEPEALYARNIAFLQGLGEDAVAAVVTPIRDAAKALMEEDGA